MSSKPAPTPFQPAPRPRPINDATSVAALGEATADLGFKRPTSAPTNAPSTPAAEPVAAPIEAKPVVEAPAPSKPAAKAKAKPASVAATEPTGRPTAVRVEMAEALSTALKMEAVRRRVTVRYLIVEALAAKGYAVDKADLQEDGRRLR